MNRPPLVAALVTASTLLALAAPAGAAPSKDWTVLKLRCSTGRKSATYAYSPTHPWWLDETDESGSGILNPDRWAAWLDNPCKGQWLVTSRWLGDPSEDSNDTLSFGTGTHGRVGGARGAVLIDAPVCDVGGADRTIITKDPTIGDRACAAWDVAN